MKKKKSTKSSTLARGGDGGIQVTITLAWADIEREQKSQAEKERVKVDIPGFRKGKAPLEKVIAKIGKEKLTELAVNHLLPEAYTRAIDEHEIKPVIFPKFELLKSEQGKDWEIRALTAELPEFDLGDYKKLISGEVSAKSIITDKTKDRPKMSREEKEQVVITTLLDNIKFQIPAILIEEEVNNRLSGLLEKVEKLGLSLDSYLTSIKKTAEELREEYATQAENAIRLELILSRIGAEQNIDVDDKEIAEFVKTAKADPVVADKLDTPEQKNVISSVLRKRKTVEMLTAIA